MVSAGANGCIWLWSLDRLFAREMMMHILNGEMNWIRPLDGTQQLLKLARRAGGD